MRKLSKERENRLMSAIDTVTTLVQQGMTPTAAITKIASAGQLDPSEVKVVAHAYNTGQTTHRRLGDGDVFSKAAEFPLADAAEVLSTLFPEQVKKAHAAPQAAEISADYQQGPKASLKLRQRLEKLAQFDTLFPAAAPREKTAQEQEYDALRDQRTRLQNLKQLEKTAAAARSEVTAAQTAAASAIREVVAYFDQYQSHSLGAVKQAAALRYGVAGEYVMAEVARRFTPKRANVHRTGLVDCREAPFPALDRAIRHLDTLLDKQAAADAAAAAHTAEKTAIQHARAPKDILGDPILPDLGDKEASFGNIAGMGALGTAFGVANQAAKSIWDKTAPPSPDTQIQKTLSELSDPVHETQLREIQTQTALQDMMLNDDVIGGHDPQEVVDAYNHITQVSPAVANRPALLQSLLRKALEQGQLDTFDHMNILQMSDKVQKQDAYAANRGILDTDA